MAKVWKVLRCKEGPEYTWRYVSARMGKVRGTRQFERVYVRSDGQAVKVKCGFAFDSFEAAEAWCNKFVDRSGLQIWEAHANTAMPVSLVANIAYQPEDAIRNWPRITMGQSAIPAEGTVFCNGLRCTREAKAFYSTAEP